MYDLLLLLLSFDVMNLFLFAFFGRARKNNTPTFTTAGEYHDTSSAPSLRHLPKQTAIEVEAPRRLGCSCAQRVHEHTHTAGCVVQEKFRFISAKGHHCSTAAAAVDDNSRSGSLQAHYTARLLRARQRTNVALRGCSHPYSPGGISPSFRVTAVSGVDCLSTSPMASSTGIIGKGLSRSLRRTTFALGGAIPSCAGVRCAAGVGTLRHPDSFSNLRGWLSRSGLSPRCGVTAA